MPSVNPADKMVIFQVPHSTKRTWRSRNFSPRPSHSPAANRSSSDPASRPHSSNSQESLPSQFTCLPCVSRHQGRSPRRASLAARIWSRIQESTTDRRSKSRARSASLPSAKSIARIPTDGMTVQSLNDPLSELPTSGFRFPIHQWTQVPERPQTSELPGASASSGPTSTHAPLRSILKTPGHNSPRQPRLTKTARIDSMVELHEKIKGKHVHSEKSKSTQEVKHTSDPAYDEFEQAEILRRQAIQKALDVCTGGRCQDRRAVARMEPALCETKREAGEEPRRNAELEYGRRPFRHAFGKTQGQSPKGDF